MSPVMKRRVAVAALAAAVLVPVSAGTAVGLDSSSSGAGTSGVTIAAQTDLSPRAARYRARLRAAVKSLPVKAEVRTGYDRDAFNHWTSQGNGCDTRDTVLIAEATVKPDVGSGCALTGGRWFSYYDGEKTSDPGSFDVDHMVPLAESWDSGARRWNARTRERFANDLGDRRSLVAVTASSNRSKSDQDPAEWMPKRKRCRYIKEYVAVKIRWTLSVDRPEKRVLKQRASNCRNVTVTVTRARIVNGSATKPPTKGSSAGLRVTAITYDPAGSDTDANVNAERVVLKNTTGALINLSGWSIVDAANHRYTFPAQHLAASASVTLHSGIGSNTTPHVYAGWGHVWNNSGDSFTLTRRSGTVEQSASYPGGGSGSAEF